MSDSVDLFIKLGDIKGESLDGKHKDEIQCHSWSFGVAQAGSMATGGGGGVGKATFHDITFTHDVDKSSPVLMQYCATGKHIKDATLTARKAGGDQQEYFTMKLTDVLVSNVSTTAGAGARFNEMVSLNFSKVQVEYKPQKADGSLDAGVKFGYDLKAVKQF